MDYYENADIDNVVKLVHGTRKGLFLGFGAVQKINDILDDIKPSYVGFVTSPGAYKNSGAWHKVLLSFPAVSSKKGKKAVCCNGFGVRRFGVRSSSAA